ncbi:Uncharacterized protein APZ42_013731 [Daphnia magna]|uniref:Uncharacterized protein n=1 Tax=Daphnia magna TaxID=35525 RepID=A0A162QJY7_9CRUS|nr:Uncharacterized protein APZ42_013731 [Daphnia magna]
MAYLMVKACKLVSPSMKARGSVKLPILSPGKSQSEEEKKEVTTSPSGVRYCYLARM